MAADLGHQLPVTSAEFTTAWERLSERVRQFEPSVVVLVARKAARMQQVLDLRFGDNALLISDLAIPFCREALQGARVAVVDDVLNVGSTLARAVARAGDSGAADVRAFAITQLNRPSRLDGNIELVLDRELDRERLREFGRLVPRALRAFDKPYDLDFPVFRCVPAVPYSTFGEVSAAFRDVYGEDNVYDVPTSEGIAAGMHRLTIDLSGAAGAHRKIRMYFSDGDYCHVVPLDIAPVLKIGQPSQRISSAARAIYSAVAAGGLPDDLDALARLRLYCDSLSLGQEFLARHADVLRTPPDALDLNDATLILGPRIGDVDVRELIKQPRSDGVMPVVAHPDPSPFLEQVRAAGLTDAIRLKMDHDWLDADAVSAFIALIDALAEWVGADDPTAYRLNWPYSRERISDEPHLRLHIGPTMPDILEIVQSVLQRSEGERERTRREVTRLLDRLIDAGAVVPTTAAYGGMIYRIYRRGEGSARDLVSSRIQNALFEYQEATKKELVPTLITKVLTVMSFSEEEEANPGVPPLPEERGNVVVYPTDLLDDGAEVFYFLIKTARLVERK